MMCSHDKAVRSAMGAGACAVVRGPGTAMVELDAGVLRVQVSWPNKPVVLACNDDGSVALELFARLSSSKAATSAKQAVPRVVAPLELVGEAGRFAASSPKM